MKRTLYSLDGAIKKEIVFKRVDFLNSTNITALLKTITDNRIILAKKDVSVYSALVTLGEKVDTRIRYNLYGRVWTFDTDIHEVTIKDSGTDTRKIFYTDGEMELVKGEIFEDNYSLVSKKWELYKKNCSVQKFLTITKNIYFKTNYGDILFAPIGTKLCIDGIHARDFYVVSNSRFKVAYTIIDVEDDKKQ